MSYNSVFRLKIINPRTAATVPETLKRGMMSIFRTGSEDAYDALDDEGGPYGSVPWYDMEDELGKISRTYDNFVFVMERLGAEGDSKVDAAVSIYRAGVGETFKGVLNFPGADEYMKGLCA